MLCEIKRNNFLLWRCIGAAMCALLLGCSEANFTLSPTDRLPRWFTIPSNMSRSEVTVSLDYYTRPWGRSATFTLQTNDGRKLDEVTCTLKGSHPIDAEDGVIAYEIATGRGITEIVKHYNLVPTFSMSDDPELARRLTAIK